MSKPILFCAAVACALATLASAEPTDDALLSQDPDKLEFVPTPDSVLELTDKDPTEEYLARYGDVQRFFSLMDEPQSEEALNQILDRMRRDRSTAGRVMELYKQLGEAANPENGFFAEARWRSLYLLGELGSTDTVAFFAELAASPLPKPGPESEVLYASEYRERARAIDGLRKLKAVGHLDELWKRQTIVSGLAAAALFELGNAPDGVFELDAKLVIGEGDPTDHNPPRARVATDIPRSGPMSTAKDPVLIVPGNRTTDRN